MWSIYNPNPSGTHTGDCVVRAITKAMNIDRDTAYTELAVQGFLLSDMPSANHVWGSYLRDNGFIRKAIPNTCPDCYTVADFCWDHPKGLFVLATGTHVVTVKFDDALFSGPRQTVLRNNMSDLMKMC